MSLRKTRSFQAAAAVLLLAAGHAGAQELYWEVSPFLTLADPEEWKFTVRLQVDNFEDQNLNALVVQHITKIFDADSGTVYFPIAPATSHAQTFFNRTEAVLKLNDTVVDEEPEIFVDRGAEGPMPAGAFLATLEFGPFERISEMSLSITTYGRSWETIYDEEAAAKIPWPPEWPTIARSLFETEMFIDYGPFGAYDLAELKARVDEWTEGDPQAQPPAVTAKWLAFKVAEAYRPSYRGYTTPVAEASQGVPTSAFGAFIIDGPSFALERGRGSKFNLPVLLTAAYRAAGIPARTVIGYDFREEQTDRRIDAERLYAWVEFALYDPTEPDETRRLTWVPVDILELQSRSVWRQPFDRPIEYFGTHKDLKNMVPIAFHFTPHWISGVSYGRHAFEGSEERRYYLHNYDISREARIFGPSFWSWNVQPAPPAWAAQHFDFSKVSIPQSSNDPLPAGAHRGPVPRRP